jgi:outer membrane protein TolC
MSRIPAGVAVCLFACLGALASRPAWTQDLPKSLTLAEAIAAGLKSNKDLEVKRLAVTAAREGVKAAQADYFPSLSGSASYTHRFFTPSPLEIPGSGGTTVPYYNSPSNPVSLSMQLSQSIFSFGQIRTSVRQAKEDLRSAQEDLTQAELSFKVQLETAFYQYLLAWESAQINRETLDNKTASLDAARQLLEAGINTEFDVLQARVDVESFRPTLLDAENRVEQARRAVAEALGIGTGAAGAPGGSGPELLGELSPQYVELDVETLLARAEHNSSSMTSIQGNIRSRELQNALNVTSAAPSLSASLGYSATSGVNSATGADVYTDLQKWSAGFNGGLSLQVPISVWFPWSKSRAEARQGAAALQGLEVSLAAQRDSLRSTIQQTLSQLQLNRQKIESGKTNVELSRRLHEAAMTQYSQGIISNLDLRSSETSLNNAQLSYLQAIYDYNATLIELQSTVGVELLPLQQ